MAKMIIIIIKKLIIILIVHKPSPQILDFSEGSGSEEFEQGDYLIFSGESTSFTHGVRKYAEEFGRLLPQLGTGEIRTVLDNRLLDNRPVFDYLKSLEIEEKINKIRWCQTANGALFLLSTNNKTIKYWKEEIIASSVRSCMRKQRNRNKSGSNQTSLPNGKLQNGSDNNSTIPSVLKGLVSLDKSFNEKSSGNILKQDSGLSRLKFIDNYANWKNESTMATANRKKYEIVIDATSVL
ncbi:uncharacterized protein A4U43_UnF3350 [Asparagus officinalis]|uniref:Alpha-ketoglutarate-dependent dioxygenase AlkB-like domain-containing protein n=1 Tax=Asparagus officinalis TaxID=4686 RepID=A0A1R3L731_ASPOF|nr:uncharacterized protein A4U43_UnF3350 [Asparagus officinalis]